MTRKSHLGNRSPLYLALTTIVIASTTLMNSHASGPDISGTTFNQMTNSFSNVSNALIQEVSSPVYKTDQIYQPPLTGPDIYNLGFYGPFGKVINNAGQFIVEARYLDPQGSGCNTLDDFKRAIVYDGLTPTVIAPTYNPLDHETCLPNDSSYENVAFSINAAGQVIGYERGRLS